MSLLLVAAAIYAVGVLFVGGVGVGDQVGFTNPDWWLVAKAALGWPIWLALAVGEHVRTCSTS